MGGERKASHPYRKGLGTKLAAVCCEGRHVVCMRICSLVPRPNTTIVGLRMRLVHKRNRELTTCMAGTVSFVIVGKVYGHHTGKALHSAPNLQLH